jgi:hypothetical protein
MESPFTEQIPGAFHGQLGLSNTSRSKKQEGSQWLIRGLKPKFSTLQNGADSWDDMALSPDLGREVSLQSGEFLKKGGIGIHE